MRIFILALIVSFLFSCGGGSINYTDFERDLNDQFTDSLVFYQTNGIITETESDSLSSLFFDYAYDYDKDSITQAFYDEILIELQERKYETDFKKADNLKEIQSEISSLSKKFNYEKDEFDDIGFYKHKSYGKYWQNTTTLTCGLNSTGYIYLKSNYFGDDWLFHTSVSVKIDEKVHNTANVAKHSDNYRTDIDGGNLWEVITYDKEDYIIRKIAENTDKEIKVRFNGSKYHKDITLNSKYKNAIKESYELSQLIKQQREL